MFQHIILLLQIVLLLVIGFTSVYLGPIWTGAWLSFLTILMNLFVMKQICIFGMDVTAADVYVIGFLSCLNLFRERYDLKTTKEVMKVSWFILFLFVPISQLHMALIPSQFDQSQEHFQILISPSLRLILASVMTMIFVQSLELRVFSWLKKLLKNRWFSLRSFFSIGISQILDTVMFSFLGLYGIVENIRDVIIVSSLAKILIIATATSQISLFRKTLETVASKARFLWNTTPLEE